MTAIGARPRAGAPPKPGGSPPFGKRLTLLEQGVAHSPRFGNRCFGYVLDPGKTTRVLSIARQVVTQRRPNAKVLPIPAQKTEALHCIALKVAICACARQRLAKHAASSAQPKWPATAWRSLWAVPPGASRWWGFLKPGLEFRAVFGTRAKHGLICNKCTKYKKYGVFL